MANGLETNVPVVASLITIKVSSDPWLLIQFLETGGNHSNTSFSHWLLGNHLAIGLETSVPVVASLITIKVSSNPWLLIQFLETGGNHFDHISTGNVETSRPRNHLEIKVDHQKKLKG